MHYTRIVHTFTQCTLAIYAVSAVCVCVCSARWRLPLRLQLEHGTWHMHDALQYQNLIQWCRSHSRRVYRWLALPLAPSHHIASLRRCISVQFTSLPSPGAATHYTAPHDRQSKAYARHTALPSARNLPRFYVSLRIPNFPKRMKKKKTQKHFKYNIQLGHVRTWAFVCVRV